MNRKSECCGCTACFHSCPVHCITMESDEEGFLYPVIHEADCVRCGKCREVCPIGSPLPTQGATSAFVGYAKDPEIRRVSSSGGIFSLAADWILSRQGVVFGAAFDETLRVRHVCAETPEELSPLRGSKYVQSDPENAYVEVKRHLAHGRWVLFTGTACQIAGLKKYLGRDYDRLLTMDVLCHGVPSPKIWEQYRKDQEERFGSKIRSVRFRDKRSGWKQYSVTLRFENGRTCSRRFPEDAFMNLFLGDICLRPSCYDCRFKTFPRVSDLTVGDCWGIDAVMPEMDDDTGTSVILVHTDKGQAMLDAMQDAMTAKRAELDAVLPASADSRRSVPMHPNRKKYLAGLRRGESFSALHRYVRKSCFQRLMGLMRYLLKK